MGSLTSLAKKMSTTVHLEQVSFDKCCWEEIENHRHISPPCSPSITHYATEHNPPVILSHDETTAQISPVHGTLACLSVITASGYCRVKLV